MHKHVEKDDKDSDDKVTFSWKVIGQFRKPLARQLCEAVHIDNKCEDSNLNSKSEYFRQSTKRITISNEELKQQCDFCSKIMKTKNELQNHVKLFHTRMNCDQCDYLSFGEYDLKLHIKSVHPNTKKQS